MLLPLRVSPATSLGGSPSLSLLLSELSSWGGLWMDLLAAVKFSLWGATLTVDPLVSRIFYGVKLFILFVDMVLFVTFIGTSGWLLFKEIIGWAKH